MLINKELESMTLMELKETAKELGLKNISKYKKLQLMEEIRKVSPAYIKKDGMILREKISPKNLLVVEENKSEIIEEAEIDSIETIQNGINEIEGQRLEEQRQEAQKQEEKRQEDKRIQEERQAEHERRERLKEMIHESDSAKGVLEMVENNNFGFLRGTNYLHIILRLKARTLFQANDCRCLEGYYFLR